jgi:hypothetical protein
LTGVFGLNPFKSCSALTLPSQNEILPSTGSNNKAFTGRFGGTSASAPQVAGIIALMKSVNPCLGIADIQHLLRYSTDRIGNGNYFGNSFYPGLSEDYGYGRVNAHKAVLAAQAFSSTDLDLYMRDKSKDFGNNSGYTWSWDFDNSPDIWVRNQQDDILVSEQIEYTQGGTTYVYVRVGNKSCVSSKGTEKLSLYWSKASSSSSWPSNWDGTNSSGDKIGTATIPILAPGESVIIEFQWVISGSSGIGTSWNTCLLARIEGSLDDPITLHPGDLGKDVYVNNNIAMKNLVIQDYQPGLAPIQGLNESKWLTIRNVRGIEEPINMHLFSRSGLLQYSEIHVEASVESWPLIQAQVIANESCTITGPNSFTINDADSITIESINLMPGEEIHLRIFVNFLTERVENGEYNHDYHVVQEYLNYSRPEELAFSGGVHFNVIQNIRTPYFIEIDQDTIAQSTIIFPIGINEPHFSYWFNCLGDTLSYNDTLTIGKCFSDTLICSVISKVDGFKDYDTIVITKNLTKILSLSPNPNSGGIIAVKYETCSSDELVFEVYSVQNAMKVFSQKSSVNSRKVQKLDIGAIPSGIYVLYIKENGVVLDHIYFVIK